MLEVYSQLSVWRARSEPTSRETLTMFTTKRTLTIAVIGATIAFAASTAQAALPVGATAPEFTAQAALGGKEFTFSLKQALAKGPVVLYFYPKSFTSGCTAEAHAFAEASPKFEALGATLIGMSHDDIATQKDFSQRECRNKFAVAADEDAKVLKRYDVAMTIMPNTAARVSFVIAPDGKVLYVYDSMNPDQHVENTLHAVQQWHDHGKAAHN
jgi:peroxiredoxin